MNEFTIELTDVELKALEYVAYSAEEWIQNAVKERCRVAIEQLVQDTVNSKLASGDVISGTKEEIALGTHLKSAKEQHEEFLAKEAEQ